MILANTVIYTVAGSNCIPVARKNELRIEVRLLERLSQMIDEEVLNIPENDWSSSRVASEGLNLS
jgi:hypothetical protein